MSEGVLYTRNLILRSFCAVYLIAFLSFYHQSEGLFGNNGILPASIQVDDSNSAKISAMHNNPTLLHLSSFLDLDTAAMIDLLALFGVIISFTGFVSLKFCILPTFAALWSLYYSLVQVAQIFTNQSDLLLLEAGAIMIILAPLHCHKKKSPVDSIGLILIRWLLFRFMFTSGAVKLASGCPHWWNLTALYHHFETMPLPTPLSWYAFHLPTEYLRLTVIFANVSELICPWLFFFPNRVVRRFAFYWQVFLQFHIIITGNYGFLNFLIVVLLFSLLDDTHFFERNRTKDIFGTLFAILILGGILFGTYHFYGVEYKKGEFLMKIMFSKHEFAYVLKSMIKASPLLASITIISSFMTNMISHPAITKAGSFFKKLIAMFSLLFFTLIAIGIVGISIVPHSNIHPSTNVTNTQLGHIYKQIKHLNFVNEYGLHLRKMRTERYEIIIEHANNIEGPWEEYGFLYKPSKLNHSLPFSGPYLPRLDFAMWEAAIYNYNDQLWVSSLAYRLLQNDPYVLTLLGVKDVLKPAPQYVRGLIYKFKYTTWSDKTSAYWKREKVGEYFPIYSLDHGPMNSFLKALKILPAKKQTIKKDILNDTLKSIRKQTYQLEGSFFLLGYLLIGFIIITFRKHM